MIKIQNWSQLFGTMSRYESKNRLYTSNIESINFSVFLESTMTITTTKKLTKFWTKTVKNVSKSGVTSLQMWLQPQLPHLNKTSSQFCQMLTNFNWALSWWKQDFYQRCSLQHSLWWNTCHKQNTKNDWMPKKIGKLKGSNKCLWWIM